MDWERHAAYEPEVCGGCDERLDEFYECVTCLALSHTAQETEQRWDPYAEAEAAYRWDSLPPF